MRLLRGLAALTLIFLISSPASAHTVIVSLSPTDGATVTTAPTQVVITTDDQVQDMGTAITVTSPSGVRVDDGSTEVDGKMTLIGLKALTEDGVYTVNYRLLAQDGHALEGSYTFTLTDNSKPSPSPTTTDEPATPSKSNLPLIVGALVVVAVTSLLLLVRRARR